MTSVANWRLAFEPCKQSLWIEHIESPRFKHEPPCAAFRQNMQTRSKERKKRKGKDKIARKTSGKGQKKN